MRTSRFRCRNRRRWRAGGFRCRFTHSTHGGGSARGGLRAKLCSSHRACRFSCRQRTAGYGPSTSGCRYHGNRGRAERSRFANLRAHADQVRRA